MSRTPGRLTYSAPIPRPSYLPNSTPKGSKAKGMQYERAVVTAVRRRFPLAIHGQWFSFADEFGPGICQTDAILRGARSAIILECKLTDREEAREQLALYCPVVTKAFGLASRGIIVTKNVTRLTPPGMIVTNLGEAFSLLETNALAIPVLHWLGSGPI